MDLQVREMTEKDSQSVYEIYRGTWSPQNSPADEPMPYHEFQQLSASTCVLVACYGQKIAGYINLEDKKRPPTSRHIVGLSIYVSPDFQGRGIGTKLIKSAEDWCYHYGKRKLTLAVLATNSRAISLYKRCGFIEEGRLFGEYLIGPDFVDDVLMYKWL